MIRPLQIAGRCLLSAALLLPSAGFALPSPARPGDVSLGLGPALLAEGGNAGAGLSGEANLLLGAFSLGLHGNVASLAGELRPAAGLEASLLGLVGLGASYRQAGASLDGLLALPLPLHPSRTSYLSIAWRPSWLPADGSFAHELVVQLKWSSLLLPEDPLRAP